MEESELALEDTEAKLLADANGLVKRMHRILRASVGTLLRSMNCYYSNLIEGHETHPRDQTGAPRRCRRTLVPSSLSGERRGITLSTLVLDAGARLWLELRRANDPCHGSKSADVASSRVTAAQRPPPPRRTSPSMRVARRQVEVLLDAA